MKADNKNNDQLIEALKDELEKAAAEEAAAGEKLDPELSRTAKQDMVSRIRQLEEQLAEKERELQSCRRKAEEKGTGQGGAQSSEHRQYPRYRVDWRVAIVNEAGGGRHVFYGRVHDISKGGVSIKSDDNLFFHNPVIVMLSVPPLVPGGAAKVIKVHSRIVYTVLASSAQQFRSGFQFLKFEGHGRKELEERLARIEPFF
jgi:flagellar biosynthesis GTPase FlhF